MANNVVFVFDLSLYSSGKEIVVFTKEPAFVILVVRIRISVKYVHLTSNSAYPWRSETRDVE